METVSKIFQATNHYDVLKVSRTATTDDVKKAYKKLAREVHPDRNHSPGATEAFKKLGAANDVLKDPQKRRDYDAKLMFSKFCEEVFEAQRREQTQPKPRERRKQKSQRHEEETQYYHKFFSEMKKRKNSLSSLKCFLVVVLIISGLVLSSVIIDYLLSSSPNYRFEADSDYVIPRETKRLGIRYFVRSFEDLLNTPAEKYKWEQQIEKEYIPYLKNACADKIRTRDKMFWEARLFGDRQLFKKAHFFEMTPCDELIP